MYWSYLFVFCIILALVMIGWVIPYFRGQNNPTYHLFVNKNKWVTPNEAAIKCMAVSYYMKEQMSCISQDYMRKLFKEITIADISEMSMRLFREGYTDANIEACRLLTIAAVRWQTHIPFAIVYIDARTRILYEILVNENTLIDVFPYSKEIDNDDFLGQLELIEKTPEDLNKNYLTHLQFVGDILNSFPFNKKHYPSFEVFANQVRHRRKNSITTKYTNEMIKSLVTVYAVCARQKLPRNYVSYDVLTLKLLQAVLPRTKPKLSIVPKNFELDQQGVS